MVCLLPPLTLPFLVRRGGEVTYVSWLEHITLSRYFYCFVSIGDLHSSHWPLVEVEERISFHLDAIGILSGLVSAGCASNSKTQNGVISRWFVAGVGSAIRVPIGGG